MGLWHPLLTSTAWLFITQNQTYLDHFITDRAEELHGKHTLFGRVVGDTIYSTLLAGLVVIRNIKLNACIRCGENRWHG